MKWGLHVKNYIDIQYTSCLMEHGLQKGSWNSWEQAVQQFYSNLFQNVIAYIMHIYLHVLQHVRIVTSSQPVAVPRSVPQSCIIRNNSLCTKAWTLFENSFVPPNKIVPKGKPTAPKICCAICSNEVEKDQVAMCVECKKNKFDVCTEIDAHLTLRPLFLPIRFSYKYGGGL